MSVRVYTPGHGLYTDTLILYGITLPLCEALGERLLKQPDLIRAKSLGQVYELEIQVNTSSDIARAISNYMSRHKSEMMNRLSGKPLGFFSEKDVDVVAQALTDTNGMGAYIQDLTKPGHSKRKREGRKGRGNTMRLPLMPIAGKYLHEDLTQASRYPQAQYKACNYCCALASLGLSQASLPILGAVGREWHRIVTVLAFEGEVNGDYFRLLNNYRVSDWERFYSRLGKAVAQLPLRVLVKYVVTHFSPTLVRGMRGALARWYVFSVDFAGRPKAPQIRGFQDLEITPLITGLSKLYKLPNISTLATVELQGLLDLLVESGEAQALEALMDFIATRKLEYLYIFARGTYSAIERERTGVLKGGRWRKALAQAGRFQELANALLRSE